MLPPAPPDNRIPLPMPPDDDEPPLVRFPMIERAAQDLADRQVLTREEFDSLDDAAKQTAFTVAGVASTETLEHIRDLLSADVANGGTLAEFREAMDDVLGDCPLAPHHVETVYRTNVAAAYSEGQRQMLDHPLVADEFPYVAYEGVHDDRRRPEHAWFQTHGLNGTNIYRRDDPVLQRFWPPWDFNCRCAIVALSLEDAAAKGVHEAREWLRTGHAPLTPQWVQPPPFNPPAGFGRGM